ncbi:GMC oxidoreductase [Pseudonocardia alni]|uniref:GMC family oxidoreductase n=1 Tax=Pseudonocardia alni TaxID=33907 RepID=UPI0033D19A56
MSAVSTARAQGPAAGHYDVVIVGSGAGGGSLAYALADSGLRILLVERGGFLPQERQNWDAKAIFRDKRYVNAEKWVDDRTGAEFAPGTYYYVGGNTKLYGASLVRFRREDFWETRLAEGVSPAWPIAYEDLLPYYRQAERVYRVHGADDDPTLPRPDDPFPYPPVEHEGTVAEIARDLSAMGLTPSHLSLGIDLRDGGRCIRCATCDAFPCRTLAKSDTDAVCVRPAVASGSVELLTGAYVERVLTEPGGRRARGIAYVRDGVRAEVGAGTVVVSGGAVNSAALLLRSATDEHPAGLANSSGVVGRHYMVHNNSVMVGVHPTRKNTAEFQKTLYLNDFYTRGTAEHPFPLGHVQLIGKLQGEMLKGNRPELPVWALSMAARRSSDWWLFSEDLPDPDNRVLLGDDGRIRIRWAPNNESTHTALVATMRGILRELGYPLVFSQRTSIEVNSHQAGTVRAGADPSTSALDPDCRAHDVENLYVVDSSFFPSLPVMNPALTIAANAFRVAATIRADHGARTAEPAAV